MLGEDCKRVELNIEFFPKRSKGSLTLLEKLLITESLLLINTLPPVFIK